MDHPKDAGFVFSLLHTFSTQHIWVVGDLMEDAYVEGTIDRVSPEAPVQVAHVRREYERLGGAGNVAHGVVRLSGRATLGGVVGADPAGQRLRALCRATGIDPSGIVGAAGRPTTRKVRVVSLGQQIIRLDWEDSSPIAAADQSAILEGLERAHPPAAIVVSDYAKGAVTEPLARWLRDRATRFGVPLLVDTKDPDWHKFRDADVLKPNRRELERAAGAPIDPWNDDALATHAERLCRETGIRSLLVTLGSAGMFVFQPGHDGVRIRATAREVYDVTGAGDTVSAVLALGLASGLSLADAAAVANCAAGVAVGKTGTSVVEPDELANALLPDDEEKVLDAASLEVFVRIKRAQGARIVFTNGCFDLLHVGHLTLLRQAAAQGDVLIVGVNDDGSVARLGKGPDRPFIRQEERARLVAALRCVDAVSLFAEDTPLALLERLRPDVLVKGADYRLDQVVGRELVESYGGRIHLVDLVAARSTTELVESIRSEAR